MDEYKKVVSSKLKFKGSVLPVKKRRASDDCLVTLNCRKKSVKPSAKLEKLIVKPGEEKNYHPVEPVEDYRTEAEKRFDERLKQKV